MAWLQLMTRTNKSVQRIMNKNQKDPKKNYAAKFYPAQLKLFLAEWPSTVLATYQLQVPCQSASPNCRAPIHGSPVPDRDPGLGNVHNYIVTLANVGKQPAWLCQWLMLLANNNRTTWQSWNYIQESPPSNSPSEPLWTANAWPSWRPHNKCVLFLVFVSTSLYWEYKNSVVVNHPLSPWTLKIKFELHSPY